MFPSLGSLLSMQGALGADSFSQFFSQSNGMLPLVAVAGVWLLGGQLLRLTSSLLPLAVLALFVLGSNSSGGGGGQDWQDMFSNFSHSGWLPILLILVVLMNMARGRLFSLQSILAISAVLYLMGARDFSLDSLLKNGQASGHLGLVIGAGALLLLISMYRVMTLRRIYPGYVRPMLGLDPRTMRMLLNYGAIAVGIALTSLLVTNPSYVEHALPGWRSGVGVALLLGSLFGLGLSLPQKARVWMMPLFWGVVCITIGVELYSPHQARASTKAPPSVMEEF